MIKLITFDLWNTIVFGGNMKEQRRYRVKYIYNLLKNNNCNIEKTTIETAIEEAWTYFMIEWESRIYTPTTTTMVNVMVDKMNIEINKNISHHIVSFMEKSLLDMDNRIIDGIEELLKKLRKDGFLLAIISDTGFTPGKYLRILLKQLNIFHYFSYFAFSDEIGIAKPDKRIFESVLNYFNVKPKEALHIGDLVRTDIVGAFNSGMHSIKFSKEQYLNENIKIDEKFFDTTKPEEIYNFITS